MINLILLDFTVLQPICISRISTCLSMIILTGYGRSMIKRHKWFSVYIAYQRCFHMHLYIFYKFNCRICIFIYSHIILDCSILCCASNDLQNFFDRPAIRFSDNTKTTYKESILRNYASYFEKIFGYKLHRTTFILFVNNHHHFSACRFRNIRRL